MSTTVPPISEAASPHAPLFTDAFALCEWLLGRLGNDPCVLARRTCQAALALLESVTLALKGRDRDARIEDADEALITLRVLIRLCSATGLVTQEQMLFALSAAEPIGRQLGGWRRSMGPA